MKKTLIIALIAIIACAGLFANGSTEQASQQKSYSVNVASGFAPEGHVHDVILKFKDKVESATDGRVKVVIHPSGALGDEREIVEGLKAGTIEMGAQGIMDLTIYAPDLTVFEEPFVIRDLDHLNKFWNTIGEDINKQAEEKTGIITAAYAIRGARLITANKEIKHPEDLKGLKFRLPSMPVRVKVFEAFGATPTIIAFPEVYMALKTGTIDAQENPAETIYSYKYYEAQKYLIMTEHVWSTARYQISKAWFETISKEDQDMFLNAWKEAAEEVRKEVPDPDAYYVEQLKNLGMTVVEVDKNEFNQLAEPVMQEFDKTTWQNGLRQKIMAL
ncbi:MAG: TRAP transporter substrate-binding protein [Spirochaetales bacterium]|nr:TRAP transporter substrate-binding protein [Spirochaetales bacterium]